MSVTFTTRLVSTGQHAAALEIPEQVVEELAAGTQVPVRVTVNTETYSATVRRSGERYLVRMGEGHRSAAGVRVGETLRVTLEHEPGRREVELPADLTEALERAGVREVFDGLAWSSRKEHALRVTEAKAQATRERRIAKVVEALRARR